MPLWKQYSEFRIMVEAWKLGGGSGRERNKFFHYSLISVTRTLRNKTLKKSGKEVVLSSGNSCSLHKQQVFYFCWTNLSKDTFIYVLYMVMESGEVPTE